MVEKLLEEFSGLCEVEAIALGGSRSGEKRLVELCEQTCPVLPRDFKANLDRLFEVMCIDFGTAVQTISVIIAELKSLIATRTDNT